MNLQRCFTQWVGRLGARKTTRRGLVALTAGIAATLALSAEVTAEQPLRVAVLKFGTVNWELDTIQHHGLDKANGFAMDVQGMAGGAAAKVAFQGGEADVIVSDWIWVARQRAAGKDYAFIPYSKAVGGLMVQADHPAQNLGELGGAKIGIAGGPLDKSWLLLQAYAKKAYDVDLAANIEPVFGAPPLMFKSAVSGELDGAINFWHFMAKMDAAGMRQLVSVNQAAEALGLDPNTPLLGYVVKGDMLREQPELIAGLAQASQGAKEILASDDAEWDRLRPRMNAKTDAQFAALKAGFRAGIPAGGPVNENSADQLLALMAELGGPELVGDATTLPEGLFVNFGS